MPFSQERGNHENNQERGNHKNNQERGNNNNNQERGSNSGRNGRNHGRRPTRNQVRESRRKRKQHQMNTRETNNNNFEKFRDDQYTNQEMNYNHHSYNYQRNNDYHWHRDPEPIYNNATAEIQSMSGNNLDFTQHPRNIANNSDQSFSANTPPMWNGTPIKIEKTINQGISVKNPSELNTSNYSINHNTSVQDLQEKSNNFAPIYKALSVEKAAVQEEISKNVTEEEENESPALPDTDVVCLGSLKENIEIQDDSQDEGAETIETECLICDKKDHTSLQCQMICKNCSQPYHNLKTCPKPPNLSIMLQHFMEFCMQQLTNYNPNGKFLFPQCEENVEKKSSTKKKKSGKNEQNMTSMQKRKRHKSISKAEKIKPQLAETTSSSSSESESSDEKTITKKSKLRNDMLSTALYPNAFAPNNTFPAFASVLNANQPAMPPAAAAVLNPMILGQLLQSMYSPHISK